jgi:hypothetical protein
MRRHTKEFLLAFALLVPSLLAYVYSFHQPWFTLGQGVRAPLGRSKVVITGLDAFDFLHERVAGGCFVWLAQPTLWVGWLLLVCRRWRAATAAGCLALVLALNTPFVFQPREGPWLPPGAGYYLWFGSMALLASSAFWHRSFFRRGPVADNETFRRLAEQQRASAAELAELKQQVAALFDHQAVAFLEQIETRGTGEVSDF